MAIFALVSVLLFVVAGLAVDAGSSYLTSNKLERAAAAAALAGVAYLPGDYPDASNAALVEAARDGFPNAGTNGVSCALNTFPCVLVSSPTTNELKVTISTSVSTIFLRLVGFGAHTVVRSETAQYLPPISLGQPGAGQGSAMSSGCLGLTTYCSNPASGLGSSGNYYFERQEGWGNPRSEGDPFDPSPAQSANTCGPSASDGCGASAAPDYHPISAEAGTATPDATLNYQGGSNYLITIPPSQTTDVQIFNPAFAPDTCGGTEPFYCYHENDTSFSGQTAPYTAYSAMEYTLFKVTTISSRLTDQKISQEIFYPYNASCVSVTTATAACPTPQSYSYFPHAQATPTAVTVAAASGPSTYHQWVSAIQYAPTAGSDPALFKDQTNTLGGGIYLTDPSGTVPAFYRLEVDSLTWNGNAVCPGNAGPCANPTTGTSTASEAHKGYAVRLVAAGGATTYGTVNATQPCVNAVCGSASAMDDMVVYTPVNGATATQFSIPLFSIDPTAYAGQTINVDLFDVGDVGGGAAYVGLQEPDGVTWANANSMTNLGASLGGANPPGGGSTVPSAWPSGSCNACYQTAGSGGGAIYNGQWIQIQIQIPPSFTAPGGVACTTSGTSNCYWNLVYNVNASATAGDTFAVEVGFSGSPDHLLP
jgi:hypothetical protein